METNHSSWAQEVPGPIGRGKEPTRQWMPSFGRSQSVAQIGNVDSAITERQRTQNTLDNRSFISMW